MIIKSPFRPVQYPSEPFHERLLTMIRYHNAHSANKIAYINGENTNEQISFQQVHDNAYSVATFLKSRGFGRNAAAVVLPNCWQYAPFFIGCAINGGYISGASALFTDYELQRQFVDSKSIVVITLEELLPKVMKAVEGSPLVKTIIAITKSGNSKLPPGVFSWSEVIATQPNFELKSPPIDIKKDILLLPYSSGTTGVPKGVMVTHGNFGMMMNIYTSHEMERNVRTIDPHWDYAKEHSLLFLPFYHIYGFGLMNINLITGAKGVYLSKFDPHRFCENIQNFKIRLLAVVPPILVFMAKNPIVDEYDLSSVKLVMGGAAPIGKDLTEEVHAKHKNLTWIHQGYGMTENSMATHLPDLIGGQPFGSVGRLNSNLEMKIVDPVTDKVQRSGDPGEICIRGPTVMLGYLGRIDATQTTIVDGWLHTGDIGYVDKDGYLFIVDRLKELIKVKGLQVPPAELEDLLLSHPRIKDAAVIGIPNAKTGELPKAYVVRADDKLCEEEVKQFVQEKVSTYKRLDGGVEFINEIPKTASGKILRRVLRERSKAKL